MNEQLRKAKQAIRLFIRANWDDQKLADVYAFNQDGNMNCAHSCCCLIGVSDTTQPLHAWHCSATYHYSRARATLPLAVNAEEAYVYLTLHWRNPQALLSAILRAEMKRRAFIGWTQRLEPELACASKQADA